LARSTASSGLGAAMALRPARRAASASSVSDGVARSQSSSSARCSASRAVDLLRDEGVARLEQPLADGIERARAVDEEQLERVGIGAQPLAHQLLELPVGGAAVAGDEVAGQLGETAGPGEGQDEGAAHVGVGVRLVEAPGAAADGGLDDDAAAQRLPVGGAAQGVAQLAALAREQLAARVGHHAQADQLHVVAAVALADHAPDGAGGDAPLAAGALDAGGDLGAARQRHRQRVEMGGPHSWMLTRRG
jgi:hypothetical protein